MSSATTKVLFGVAAASACALAGVVVFNRHAAPMPVKPSVQAEGGSALQSPREAGPPPQPATAPGPLVPPVAAASPDTAALPPVKAAPSGMAPAKPVPAAPAGKAAAVQDPVAREALSLVGADPTAEAYWIGAINDTRLSADERQNLIEDLNEDGLSDPKRPGPEDLPLILNRLALIEDLATDAMDEVNLAAFKEAYKDLQNLAEVAMGGGQPVN